jgi:hypothetical protein
MQESDFSEILSEFLDVLSGEIGMIDVVKCKYEVPGTPIAQLLYVVTPKQA